MKKQETDKNIVYILCFSFIAILFLFWLIYRQEIVSEKVVNNGNFAFLSAVNAFFNGISALFLLQGFLFIKRKKIKAHKICMTVAFISSTIFLCSYVVYHYFHGSIPYVGQGIVKYVYFFILITHIILSVIVLPIILFTFYFALKQRYSLHKKIAKYTFPIWLYVSITGIIIYFMLKSS